MPNNRQSTFSSINKHPFISLFILGLTLWFWPDSIPKVHSERNTLKVDNGFTYKLASELELEIYPFMLQKRFLGTPTEAGVSSSVYYVTKTDLITAKKQFEEKGGCWPSTISAFKRELLIVGDNSKIKTIVKSEGPPPLHGNPDFIKVKGTRLNLISKGESAQFTSHIANSRNAHFFSLRSAWRL